MTGDAVRMPPAEIVRRATGYLERHGVDSPRSSAEVLLMRALGTDRAGLARAGGLSTAEARWFGRALCRRGKGVPLQHLTGETGFMGLSLLVEPGVFVPRPETEALAEAALGLLQRGEPVVVVDVGTGTGAIALAVASRLSAGRVLATDASAAAVDLARRNARRLELPLEVFHGDLLEPLPPELAGAVDLIVSNPPYLEVSAVLPPEVEADPPEALFGGTQLHRRLAVASARWLRPGGWLVMEMGEDQAAPVRDLLAEAGLDAVRISKDLAGRDRVAAARRPG